LPALYRADPEAGKQRTRQREQGELSLTEGFLKRSRQIFTI
jgi:hypothetical protein